MIGRPYGLNYDEPTDQEILVVEWNLGSICNYYCSYCPPHLHDGKQVWPEFDTVLSFIDSLTNRYKDRRITILFTGGEITLCNYFQSLSQILSLQGMSVCILSNGSRKLPWWHSVAPFLSEVILSYHIEHTKYSHFRKVVKVLSRHGKVYVNFNMVPQRFNECCELANRLLGECEGISLMFKPLLYNWNSLYEYTSEQLRLLGRTLGEKETYYRSVLKGNLREVYADETFERVSAGQLIVFGRNRWKGWWCQAGLEHLLIRCDRVFRGACEVGGCLGNIYDRNFKFPDDAVVCPFEQCNCIGSIKVRKCKDLVYFENNSLSINAKRNSK